MARMRATLVTGRVARETITRFADDYGAKYPKALATLEKDAGSIGEGKWKAFCVCNPNERVGVIESFNGIPNLGVTCTVPDFNAQGEYVGGGACYDWTPMAK